MSTASENLRFSIIYVFHWSAQSPSFVIHNQIWLDQALIFLIGFGLQIQVMCTMTSAFNGLHMPIDTPSQALATL